MPLLPGIGQTVNGARLWIHFGGLQFQPGELGKIALIVFLAAYLREKREVLAQGRLKDWGPLLVIWGGAMLVLFATDDLGSALLYYGIFLAILYAATARVKFVAAFIGLFLIGSVAVYQGTPHVRERVTNWLTPFDHAQGLLRAQRAHGASPGLRELPARAVARTRSRTAASAGRGSDRGRSRTCRAVRSSRT